MKRMNHVWYKTLCAVARFGLFFWHPLFHVAGQENVPQGPCVIACNHSGMADPIWIMFALRLHLPPRILGKAEVLRVPVLGPFLKWVGLIGVRRGENDIAAIKTALKALKDGEKLLVFPEGTRVKSGNRVEPKTGAVMFAMRTQTPVLPVWLKPGRTLFSPMRAVIGAPYVPQCEADKASGAELRQLSETMMDRIYAMGETI